MQKLLIEHIRRVYHGFESVAHHHHIIHLLTGEAMGTGLWEGQLPPPIIPLIAIYGHMYHL